MHIGVRLGSGLVRYTKSAAAELTLPAGATVRSVVELLAIAPARVGIISLNGSLADLGDALADGDELWLFPPVTGGA